MNTMHFSLVLLVVFAGVVKGHSWAQCVDYTEENGQYWDPSRCRAFPREYATRYGNNPVFGGDVGMDYIAVNGVSCRSPQNAGTYTATYPAARYAPGQRVCLAWPPKNHVSANCQNPFIPDDGTKIFRSGLNPTQDPTTAQFRQNLVWDFGRNTAPGNGVGFQNCPNFCADNGASLCTGCFNVPNLASGQYTFLWEWGFNNVNYSTCWDITIDPTVTNRITSTLAHIGPDAFAQAKAGSSTVASSTAAAAGTATATGTATGTAGAPATGTATATATAGAATGAATGNTANTGSEIYGPCPYGTLRCNCTSAQACDKGLVCTSNVCVSQSEVNNVAESTSLAGPVAAAVIVTFIAVGAVFVGLVFIARKFPHSALGGFMQKAVDNKV